MTADELDRDPVFQLLFSGRARTLAEAEEMYLDAALPELYELLESGLPDDELARHPLVTMLIARGSRPREDSLL